MMSPAKWLGKKPTKLDQCRTGVTEVTSKMLTIDWKPTKANGPLYKQIADYIRKKIGNGEWPVGSRIPSERALAQAFGVNRSTVVTALAELTAEGLLMGNSGSGTRVINNTWTLMASGSPPDWDSYVKAGIHQPNLPTIQEINQAEFLPGIVRLGTGEPSFELYPGEKMQRILHNVSAKVDSLGYLEPKGLLYLREQICSLVKKRGINASPASILIVSGALQALQLISVGILQRGSTVLMEKPSYLQSLHVFQSAGMQLVGLPMDEQGLMMSALLHCTRQQRGTILYTIPSFHNPTGIVMTAQRRHQLLSLCEKEQLPIIEDDVYRDLWLDETAPPPLKADDKNGLVLYLGSMSKSLSPGLRIGWLIGPEPVVNRLADLKMQMDYGASSLSQWAVAEFLTSGLYEEHLQDARESLRKRRETALAALNSCMSGLAEWRTPAGGFYIWLKLIHPVSMRELFETALRQGILLNPGNLYDKGDQQHIRLSYSYASLKDLEKGIKKLAQIVNECKK